MHTNTHIHTHTTHTSHTSTSLQSMQCEIERLDSSIAGGLPVDTLPIHLCRRGALLRKVHTVEHLAVPSAAAAKGAVLQAVALLCIDEQHALCLHVYG